jgi:hypothetical protein
MHSPRPNTLRLEKQYVGDEEVSVATLVVQRVTYRDPVYVLQTGSDGSARRSKLEPEQLRVTGFPPDFDWDAGWNWMFSYYVQASGRQLLRIERIDRGEVRFILG